MSSNGNDRFNEEAATWDSNPEVHLASRLAHKSIIDHLLLVLPHGTESLKTLDVLEIGCGTGLLSMMFAPQIRSLTAVDASPGMIKAFQIKLSEQNSTRNVLPVCAMISDPNDPRISPDPLNLNNDDEKDSPRRFDLVISHLVLHHIPSLSDLFSTIHGCLKPGGIVATTDFEDFGPEARKFHPESRMDGVERHGIRRGDMKALLSKAGFTDAKVEAAFEMERDVETAAGESSTRMTFPFLICTATKRVIA